MSWSCNRLICCRTNKGHLFFGHDDADKAHDDANKAHYDANKAHDDTKKPHDDADKAHAAADKADEVAKAADKHAKDLDAKAEKAHAADRFYEADKADEVAKVADKHTQELEDHAKDLADKYNQARNDEESEEDLDKLKSAADKAHQDADKAHQDADKAHNEETAVKATIQLDLGHDAHVGNLYVQYKVFDGTAEDNHEVKTGYVKLSDAESSDFTFTAYQPTGTHLGDSYTVTISGVGTLSNNAQLDLNGQLISGSGSFNLVNTEQSDLATTRVIEIGSHDVLVEHHDAPSTLNGLDIITNYHAGDLIDFTGLPSVATYDKQTYDSHGIQDDSNIIIDIKSHQIANGIVTFYSDSAHKVQFSLVGDAEIAKALDYLTHHDIGNSGAVVVFEDASKDNSYVYSQTTDKNGAADSYSFVKLESFNAISSETPNHIVSTLHIE